MLVLANPGTRYEGGALTGNLGSAWQGGTWTVRRLDGSPVGVTGVHRHSIPVGQPDYPVAYNRYGSDNIVDVDHRIFLVLQEPIGERDILQVAHSGASGTALDVRVPFSDRYLETPFIQVNQVGYNPRATERWAYVSGWMGGGGGASFAGIPATAEVLAEPLDPRLARPIVSGSLPVSVRVDNNSFAGSDVRQIDLSSVRGLRWRSAASSRSGRRRLLADGGERRGSIQDLLRRLARPLPQSLVRKSDPTIH